MSTTATANPVNLYRIVNVKRDAKFRGTLTEAVAEAGKINDLLQPSWGTQVELNGEILHDTEWPRFAFATDGESGLLQAEDFDAACQKLASMFSDETISNGAWGWVRDADGFRHMIAPENMP